MIIEDEIRKDFDGTVEFLKECDAIVEDNWSLERHDAYMRAVERYEVLHKILEIPGEPEWCS
jgi:hypothetical protein